MLSFSSDAELFSYVEKAKLKGLSLAEVETLATAQGAKLSEIQLLRKLWNAKNDQLGDGFDTNRKFRKVIISEILNLEKKKKKKKKKV